MSIWMKLHCRYGFLNNRGNALMNQRVFPSTAAELQQCINALRHLEHCFLNFEHQISPRAGTHIVTLEELGVRIDRRERVTHIVGYRACHTADCRHPLDLGQLASCAPLWSVLQIQTNALIKLEDIDAV
jgi:hypothetical protein